MIPFRPPNWRQAPLKTLFRILLALVSTAVFFAAAEGLYRMVGPVGADEHDLHARWRLFFRDAEGDAFPTLVEAWPKGLVRPVPPKKTPRPRFAFAPDSTFYMCYTGLPEERRDEFDATFPAGTMTRLVPVEDGADGETRPVEEPVDASMAVRCDSNSLGLREREEVIRLPKPDGERRVLCIGDSFTFGWGVKVEDVWVRRIEVALRERDPGVRTVNAGAAGAIYADEYAMALEKRFHVVDPDVFVVTLCLNDLIPSSQALAHQETAPWLLRQSFLLRDLVQSYALQGALTIDPDRDLVQELLDLPQEYYPAVAPWVGAGQVTREDLWPGGGVQRALLSMRDWCAAHDVRFGVVIWPYFQGLGPGEHYPFEKLHRLVGEFCTAEGMAFLDVLPALRGVEKTSDLWVSPADYHGNRRAQELASPSIAAFVGGLLGLGD